MKIYLHNPSSGSRIKNWFDGSDRWSLDVDEVKAFPPQVAQKLKEVFGFLQQLSEGEGEQILAKLEEKELSIPVVKVSPEGVLVAKLPEEIAEEKEVIKVKKAGVKQLVEKIKKAVDAKPVEVVYEELSRGELIAEAHKRNIEIKGLGKSYISKESIIMLLENDDAQKE